MSILSANADIHAYCVCGRVHIQTNTQTRKQRNKYATPGRKRAHASTSLKNRKRSCVAQVCSDVVRIGQVKKFIPQHILAGVWRGNYGRNGWETVELHYEGTKLIATKVR